MIASLMMYARPELEGPHQRYWSLIREALAQRGIGSPETLSNTAEEFSVWRSPDLVLSQTCGMPYRLWLHADVGLVGTPDYGLEGCPPGYYRSPIVVRADEDRAGLEDFQDARLAYNVTHSQSGFASIYNTVAPQGFWFDNRVETGGHHASAQAVAEGRADLAALDAVTWALIQRYDGFASQLRVLEWTAPTPGLPYITAATVDTGLVHDAMASAIDMLDNADRADLMLQGLVRIPKETYLAVPNPPPETRS